LNLQKQPGHVTRQRVKLQPLDQVQVSGWNVALLAETLDVEASARRGGGQEQLKGRGRRTFAAIARALICIDRELAKVGIHASASGKVNIDLHR
jgi:hypothetical protein